MPNDNLKNLYTYLTTQKKIELPDYNTFENDMQNESNLNGFYKNITDRKIELPPYDVFVSDMGLKKKDNSGEDYPNLVKVQSGSSQENNIPLSGTLASEFIPSKSQGSGAKTTQSDVATENKIDLSIAEKKIEGYRQSEFVSPEENADWEKAIKRKRELKSNIITKTKPIVRDYIDRLKPTIESSADKSLAYDEIETQLSKKFDKQTVKEALKDYQQNDIEEKAAKLIESNNLTDITYLPDRYVEEVKGYLRGEGYKDEAVENAVSNITRNASKYELETKGIKTLKDEAKQTALRLGISKEDIAPFEEQYITQKAIDNTHNFFGEQELEKMQKQIQLNKLMDNPNKTVDDRVKINKLNQEIAEKYPNPIRMYNAFGEAYTDQNTIQEKTQQVNALENEYKISFKDKLKQGFLEKYAAYNQALNNHNEIIKPITSGSSADRLIKQSDPDIIARIEKSSQVLDKAQMEYIAMSKLYLLNESAANVKKDVGFYASGAVKAMVESFASSVGAENVAKKLPKTDRDLLNSIDMVMSDNDIKKSPLEAKKIEQGLFEQTLNATSSIVGILPSLMALNKAQGLIGLTGIIGRLTAAERTVKTAEGLYKLEKNPIFSKVIGHALGAMAEEAKMQAIGSETGVGTGFYLGVKTGFGLPIKGKYSAILKPYFDKLVGGSIGGTIGMETGEVAKELSGALFNDKDLDYRLKEMYPSMDVFGKRMIVNLISNSLLGVTHLSKTDLTSNPEVLKKMSLEYKVKASELRKEGKESEADSHEQLAKVIDNKAKNIEKDGEDKPMPLYEPAERKVITVEAREEKPTYIINGEKKTKEEVIEYAEKNKGEENTDKIEVINDTETADKVETILTKIDDAVGKDIDYNGIDGILIKEDDGFYVLGDNGEKTLIESGESGKSISDLGIKVFPEITEADINNAVKDAEQLGEVKYNGKKYFVATANPMKENSIGDKVFQMNDDGSVKREMGGTSGNDKKQSIVNKFISEKGLPKRTTDNTVKPKEPKVEGETKGVNEGVNIATKPEKVSKNSLEVPEPVKDTKAEVIQEEKPEIKSETLPTKQKTEKNPLKDVESTKNELEKIGNSKLKKGKLDLDYTPTALNVDYGDITWQKSNLSSFNEGSNGKMYISSKDGGIYEIKKTKLSANNSFFVIVKDYKGNEVGRFEFKKDSDGKFYAEEAYTSKKGIGIAAIAYDFASKDGYTIKPSKKLKKDGISFWSKSISESYHKAKVDGSNPELVKAVEELLGEKPKAEKTEPVIEPEQELIEKGKSKMASAIEKAMSKKGGLKSLDGGEQYKWRDIITEFAEGFGDVTQAKSKEFIKELKKEFNKYAELTPKIIKEIYAEIDKMQKTLTDAYTKKREEVGLKLAKESEIKKSKDIISTDIKKIKEQVRSQRRGAVNLKNEFNKIFSERAKELTNIGITAKHTRTLLNKIVGDGSKAIEWFDKLIADKDYANDYSLATDIQKEIITKIKNGDFSDVSRIRAEMLSNYDVSELTKEHLKEFVTDMNSLLTSGEYAAETVALAFDKVSKYPELNVITPEETTIQKVTKITDILDEKYDIVKMLANKMKKLGEKNIVVTPYNIVNEYLKLVDTKINKIGQLASENGYLYDYVTGQFMRFDSKTKELVFDREMEGISKEYKELLEESKNYEKAIEKFNQSTDAEVKISKQEYEDILKDEKNAVIKNITNMSSKINRNSFINNAHKKLADKFIGLSFKILDKMTPKQLNMVEKAVSDLLFQNVTKHTHDTLNEINAVKTGEKLQKPLNTLMESFLGKEWGSKNLRKRNIKEITNILSVRAVSQLDAVWNTYLTDNNKVNFKRAMKILVGSDIHRTNKGFFSELYRPYADALQKYNRHLAEYQKGLAENLFIGKWESAKRPFKGDFDAFLKSSGLTNKEVAEVGVVLRQLDYYFNDILKNTNASDLKTMIDKGKTKDPQTYADNKWVQDALFHVLDLSKLKSEFVSGRKNAKYETISGTKEDKALHEAYDSLIDKNKGGLGDLTSEAKALSLLNKNQIKLYKFYRDLMSKNRDMADAVATMQGRSLNERDYYSALYSMESLEIADVSKLNPFARKPKMKTGNTIDREAFGVKKYDPNVFRNMDRWMEDMGKNFFVDNAIKEVNKTLDKIKEQSTPENEVFISSFIGAVKQDFNNRVLVEFTQQNASAFTNWVASKTGMYTLASPVRVPAELLSNFMQHPFTNTSEIIKSIQAGGFVKEYNNMRSIANEFGSYTFEKEIDMSKHLEKVQATSQTQTWAGEILQSGVKGMITVSDKLVRPLLFAGTIHQMFEARTGEKFNAEKFVTDKEYKEKHKELVKELVEEADIQVQDDYMDYNKSLQAYELKSLLPKNTINKYSGFGKSMSWIASFPIKQGIRQMDAAKTLITGTPEQKLKATRTIAAIQMQNIIYFATMNAVSNAMALGIAKLTGNKKEEEYALERMKDISSGKFWAENVIGNLVQTPINQYGSFARLGLGVLAMFYKMNEYDESGMSESQKKKAKDEAQQFSSSLFYYGVKVFNIRFENEKEAFGDLIESLPLYGALGKMGFDFMGVGVELTQIGDEKYEATKEMQKEIAGKQIAVAMAHIINLASRSTVIPKDIVKLIDSEIKQDKIEKSKKRKMIE